MEHVYLDEEQENIKKILISIIMVYGESGLPLDKVQQEFIKNCGYRIPYKKFGADTLKSWLITLPDIYLVMDNHREVLIQQSSKSFHIKQLISKQKSKTISNRRNEYSYLQNNAKKSLQKDCFIDSSINCQTVNDCARLDLFSKLESMLPLFYKHQALGDDFLLDIADSKMGYYVSNGSKECGLCVARQTISELTEKVRKVEYLAPRVVVMIGFHDLLLGHTVNKMIYDLQDLVIELKKKNTTVTLITLIPSPKLPRSNKLEIRMDTFNKAVMDYAYDDLKCNVIDMNTVFNLEMEHFQKDCDRFMKIAKKDTYKVFSDYGRKVFISTLRSCLRHQIETGR